jgi:SAM-dependent methyltransferase
MTFNHNDHYHPFLLTKVPVGCRRALDVGCGHGTFARLLAAHAAEVDAVDRSADMIAAARAASADLTNLTYVEADIRSHDLPAARYDFISCIAAIHHVPFAPTVARLHAALAPGGVLAILGLSRPVLADYLLGGIAFAPNKVRTAARLLRGTRPVPEPPIMDPVLTLPEIRAHARDLLPGAQLRRHLYWRYSLVYRKPSS